MQSRSETHQQPNGAQVEVGTITLDGREFAAVGSIVDTAGGLLVGYVHEHTPGYFELRTWEGQPIVPLRRTARVTTRLPSADGSPMVLDCYSATYQGRVYSGRHCSAWNQSIRLRAGRAVKSRAA